MCVRLLRSFGSPKEQISASAGSGQNNWDGLFDLGEDIMTHFLCLDDGQLSEVCSTGIDLELSDSKSDISIGGDVYLVIEVHLGEKNSLGIQQAGDPTLGVDFRVVIGSRIIELDCVQEGISLLSL